MFKLVIQDDEGKTTVVPLIRDEITIGRKEGNTIRLTERNVSRKHAKISRANGSVAIEDLGSYNGVKVNGTRIMQKVQLSVSDRVQIGDYLIELKAEGAEQPANASFSEDARTQPIERLDPAALGALGMAPPPQPVSQPMALADTDPARRAAAAAAAPAAAPAAQAPARLVVLSSNFAGREFAITKSPMVIGRTEDNDIVINHRSISRNHAQILRDGAGRFSIEDMQSANGVRVNGEDYGKVELRRGDTIDLGHVRLRFVEPGEDFLFGRDAQVVDVPQAGSKKWLFGLLGLGAVAAVVVVVMVASGGKKSSGTHADTVAAKGGPSGASGGSSGSPSPGSAAAGGSAGSAVAMGTGSEGPGSATGPAGSATGSAGSAAGSAMVATGPGTGAPAVDSAAVAAAIADAKAAVNASDWDKASQKAQAALKLDPGNADAKAIADQASRESTNAAEFKNFTDAASAKAYERAVEAFDNISTDSVYKNQARTAYDQLHDEFISARVANAKTLAKLKRCADVKRLAITAGNTFPDAKDAIEKVPCEDETAHNPGPGTGGGSSETHETHETHVEPPPSGDWQQLLNDADSAAKASQWGRALTLAEQAGKGADASGKIRAYTIAGLAACNVKNAAKAKTYYKLVPTRQTLLRQQCLKQGIDPAE
ncbi:MAG TPA: FHA domain-containing protein [Kofleriaceae bacterium]|nr:FHA domain-containing protein [Kofleriaceae bacterium]